MSGQRGNAIGRHDGPAGETAIRVRLDELLSERGMTLTELSARVDITIVNLSVLKNGRARAIRFTTMARLCQALRCQPGDLLSYEPPPARSTSATPASPKASGSQQPQPGTTRPPGDQIGSAHQAPGRL